MPVFPNIFTLLIITALSFQAESGTPKNVYSPVHNQTDYYEAGIRELENGNWKEALNIWLKAKTGIKEKLSHPDPRIGFAFIEVVTDKSAEQYYELANTMYFWGIDVKKAAPFKEVFREELSRLQPIMDDSLFTLAEESFKRNDTRFTALLREFWIKQDPFPSSAYNERLLEHWTRINWARKNYLYAKDTVYGTDDRGLIYVKYGEPLEIKKRNISINSVTDPVTGARIDLINNISFDFEVWYYLFDDKKRPSTFAFGHPGTGGAYGLQPGILSMVPVAGNRVSGYFNEQETAINLSQQSSNGGVLQGAEQQDILSLAGHTPVSRNGAELMIKYAVLEDIGAIDPFYNELHVQMTRDIIRAELTGTGEKFTKSAQTNLPAYDHKEQSAYMLQEATSPREVSIAKSNIENLLIVGKFFRFLDKSLTSIYMLVTEAIDFAPIFLHLESDQESEIYQLNTLYEYDNQWRQINKQPHILPLNQDGHFGKGIYYFDDRSTGGRILLDAQFLDRKHKGDPDRFHKEFNAEILASTHPIELSFPDGLKLNPELNIQLSDIILGDGQVEDSQNRIPFTPNITSVFDVDQEIIVYFEVYNLPEHSDYQMEYFFEEAGKKQKKVTDKGSIILNYVSTSRLDKRWFSASLSDLKKDTRYHLVLTLSVPGADETISRNVSFSTAE